MNQKSIEINPNDILEEYGLFAYHEYLVTGKIMEVKENDYPKET